MSEMDPGDQNFEEMLRSMAGELGRFIERSVESVDVEQVAESIGVDSTTARDWVESAGTWLRGNAENLGEEVARRFTVAQTGRRDPLGSVGPDPLDLPSDDQGRALAALESGRWTVEPGTETLAAAGEGPAPSDALGLLRELRVRDWITSGGELTLSGRAALSRWLDSAAKR